MRIYSKGDFVGQVRKECTMSKKPHPRKQPASRKVAAAYTVDAESGEHRYWLVEGVGECRENFKNMLEGDHSRTGANCTLA
jgi:hypothetical protein